MWLHARRLIEAALEASIVTVAAGVCVAALRASGFEIPPEGQTLDPARFFAAPTAFLAARLLLAEALRLRPGLSHHLRSATMAGAVLPFLCLGVVRGFELVAAYIPVPAVILDASFWGTWTLIPIGAAATIVLVERKAAPPSPGEQRPNDPVEDLGRMADTDLLRRRTGTFR
jgi:hypothetical protein